MPFDSAFPAGAVQGPDRIADGERRTTLDSRPLLGDRAPDPAPADRWSVRRQAEADMRAAMKTGDLDGVRTALKRIAPGVLA
ncbi:hypothetical protein [Roseiarcus fermentans]|uniref:hypothetical protein n=1 Tax=Roseiarcus fermentans TaxID=1473586 RepID=UPI000DE8261C|nr:hypothetical protein [Roseiarcus fermentans]